MYVREVDEAQKEEYEALVSHPMQSWAWGEFRKDTGVDVVRLGVYENDRLGEVVQITFHTIPYTSWKIGYIPKGNIPSDDMLDALVQVGKERRCLYIQMEPNVIKSSTHNMGSSTFRVLPSAHPLFTKYTFHLDLSRSENELRATMHPKTRYNIKVAQKHGVNVQETSSQDAFEEYLRLTQETTKRQKFFAHTPDYHRKMWNTLKKEGIAHLFTATIDTDGRSVVLATWIVFLYKDVLYYPYGASSENMRHTMASNLMMWEVIRWGKAHGARMFDMWGALGPQADPHDPWYGFHTFKQRYGAELVEYIGSYDLVISPFLYPLFVWLHTFRGWWLRCMR